MPISYLARFTCRVCSSIEVVPIERVYTKPFESVARVHPTHPLGWMYDCCPSCKEAEILRNKEYCEKLFASLDEKP